MPAIVSETPVLLPLSENPGFQDPLNKWLSHREVVIYIAFCGDLFGKARRALISLNTLAQWHDQDVFCEGEILTLLWSEVPADFLFWVQYDLKSRKANPEDRDLKEFRMSFDNSRAGRIGNSSVRKTELLSLNLQIHYWVSASPSVTQKAASTPVTIRDPPV